MRMRAAVGCGVRMTATTHDHCDQRIYRVCTPWVYLSSPPGYIPKAEAMPAAAPHAMKSRFSPASHPQGAKRAELPTGYKTGRVTDMVCVYVCMCLCVCLEVI